MECVCVKHFSGFSTRNTIGTYQPAMNLILATCVTTHLLRERERERERNRGNSIVRQTPLFFRGDIVIVLNIVST